MIKLSSVSKKFGTTVALHETNLDISTGKTTVLIGPSGCGKSTILRLIIGLLEPTSGTIEIDGERLTPTNILSLRRRIGYVIQEGGLFAHLTARQNILLMAKHLKQPAERMETRLHELCELTHFPEDGLSHYPVELSGGQRQRVSLMRALMLQLKEIFHRLQQTIVMVTHDMAEAGFFADCIVLLNEGRIVQSGTFDDLRTRPATEFAREFLRAQRAVEAI
jgi:osmoprotectant transport system ATP-binding protein